MNNNEIRRLPKKTIFIIGLLIVIGLAFFLFLKSLKEQKLTEVLNTIGHENIKDLKVINKMSVEDTQTRYKSTVYKVMFYDNNLKQTCIGFIHREKDAHYTKDIDCK
ncbi:MAG: hypothetical protein AB7S49_00255 [Arcobacter sp.]|jgi:hypothetical protein|uniref:Uncharacterized protein n=1 Tax=Arcobacter defluvii TaxID=873191 RepID=A0AAE7E556_9BACT|nr:MULTISPECIES: hypothetical protein [Arcobacter]MDY3199351.1 hypothetical protein [Arcobacter sp.]QKF76460.1 hypothetical protein ADFLV_0400 [Arcobacter defluvii]RXI34609.1 hypothetical protein CP964_00485 [Arcobacter defluvii]BAK72261.1 conserved hypothetical protein [Arcobacter sp. L]